jgi:Cu+-exporting ATPase
VWLDNTWTIFHHDFQRESFLLWLLATPVQFACGWTFYQRAYYNILNNQLGMDVLVVLGTTASYGYALVSTIGYGNTNHNKTHDHDHPQQDHGAHFFETSAVLICFVLLGKWMNALAVRRTSDALTQLMKLQAKTAIRVISGEIESPKEANGVSSNPQRDWNPTTDSYEEQVVPIDMVQAGDIVKVIRGASIPADGIVLHGEMTVDESMITGESVPVLKTQGSMVLGGTICVETATIVIADDDTDDAPLSSSSVGAAFCVVTGVGSSTALAQIVQLVQDAQTRQVPIQNFADTISSIFVPTVATISVITFLVWYALCNTGVVPASWYTNLQETAGTFSLMFGVACLVISCPCALGLATPTAVMVGTGIGAKHGVLLKGGEALEKASKVNSVVFDKTGTLTKGKPEITNYDRLVPLRLTVSNDSLFQSSTSASRDKDEDDLLLWLMASLERNSEHPLATAVVAYANAQISPSYLSTHPFAQPSNFRALTGRGASGTITIVNPSPSAARKNASDTNTLKVDVAVGNRAFCTLMKIEIPSAAEEQMKKLEDEGKTAILATVNNEVCAVIGIADELKPDAGAAISYLRNKLAIDVWMVTGDNSRTASDIARRLNLPSDRVISEALPVAKVQQVLRLQNSGRIVAMVGDGVNDSPALAQADVGMSLGTGAEIAAEASDLVLVRGHVQDVCTALNLSRVIFRRIQWNFLWALVYNCLGIPVAAGVLFPLIHTRLPPTVAALAMALSSLSVVSSSLALRFYRPPKIIEDAHEQRRRASFNWFTSHRMRPINCHEPEEQQQQNDLTLRLLENDYVADFQVRHQDEIQNMEDGVRVPSVSSS